MSNEEKIEVSYRELVGTPESKPLDSLNHLLDREDFPVIFGHKISKLATALFPEFEHANKMFNKLVRKHGKLNEDKTQFVIDPGSEAEKAFSDEYAQFLDETTTLRVEKISLEEVGQYKVKPRHLKNLHKFFTE
jgi:hypothetical protein